ncbi:MAG: ABC transporter substrate-binding protein [Pseudomonadota bacterium]
MFCAERFTSGSLPMLRGAAVLLGAFSIHTAVCAATVTDVSGRTVTIPAKVERIVVGFGVFSAFAAVEGPDSVKRMVAVGADLKERTPALYAALQQRLPALKDVPTLGAEDKGGISAEQVLALKPDVAIFGGGGDGPVSAKEGSLQAKLEQAGVAVVYVDFRSHPMRNTVPSIRTIAKLIGREQEGETFVRYHEEQLRRVTDVVGALPANQKPRLFMDMRAGGVKDCCGTPGNGNYGDFIVAAGAVNVGAELHANVLGSAKPEAIAAAQPQLYVAGGASAAGSEVGVQLGDNISAQQARTSLARTIAHRPGVTTLAPVQSGKVGAVWHNFYNHPFNVVAVQALAKIAHPARFQTLDPNATQREMLRRFLHVDLNGTYWIAGSQP